MYDVRTCGACVHERVAIGEAPCNDCRELKSKSKKSYFRKDITGKECEETGKACEYGICSECDG